MKRILITVAFVAVFAAGFILRGGSHIGVGNQVESPTEAEATIWTCSMHPQIQLPKPGKCPICFMDLIPLEHGHEEDLGPRSVQMSPGAAALADIRTTVVRRGQARSEQRLIGRIDFDETMVRTIPAWIGGRIDTLFVDSGGARVAQGDPVASIYSPELYAAQAELLSSLEALDRISGSSDAFMRSSAEATIASARRRLSLWGLNDRQIQAVEKRGQPSDHLRIFAPLKGTVVHKMVDQGQYVTAGQPLFKVADLSRVWLLLEAYESDLPLLAVGQDVAFTVASLPGRKFSGPIIFIDPVLDPRTRTADVRVEVDNADGRLLPGVFADAILRAILDDEGRPSSDSADSPLLIPASAPLITGKRALVYVRDPGHEKPTFTGKEVVLGPRAGNDYIVLDGLQAGELVVTNGNFKIDSALQIQAKPSMMNPGTESANPAQGSSPEFRNQLGGVLAAYLRIQSALAGDRGDQAASAAKDFLSRLEAVDMTLLGHDDHQVWMPLLTRLTANGNALMSNLDLGRQRAALLDLGPALWNALDRFGYDGPDTLRRFHCPMANENKGGDWIQLKTTTANPYFGPSMLLCGSQTDSLTPNPGR
ncbi:hypothetical protein COW53_07960 [bacterium CG17_big_fil_post_rev_8_21_14_2_50_64_8]|nr:MAG: hypothetical protein COW53_07960 [bacterium CG17_big_fil_post_rev_8_21_14_2_50_64_8]PJA74326.1 MAG: hypothetical protein CO151_10165 [bacterium CG_4_9_14_3_um_filter_65_15]